MKQGFDREIDSLLRRGARAAARDRANGEAAPPQTAAHLDADELSAFAENALPAPARMAAAAHLSDCDECRRVVITLSGAANVSGELEKRAPAPAITSQSATRRGWLGALFAPRVLRLVAPALALCLIGAVAFVALRSRRDAGEVARQTAKTEEGRVPITKDENAATTATEGLPEVTQSAQPAEVASASAGTTGAANTSAPPQSEMKVADADAKPGLTAAGKSAEAPAPPPPASDAQTEVGAAAAPRAAPAEMRDEGAKSKDDSAPARQESEAAGVGGEVARQANQTNDFRIAQSQQMPDGARNQARSAANNAPSRGDYAEAPPKESREAQRGARAPSALKARRSRSETETVEEDEAVRVESETRAVAGHRFSRQGGAWVDVNYKASMPMTGVRRGTDGYRALVADLPEVGRIAEQLSGEVVIVIRGRAYRIR